MRSRVGDGITPPNVLLTPKPVSSVMIKRILGAPLGGTTRGGHQGFDCATLRPILPPNFIGGGGSCLPSIERVAPGEPGASVICCCAPAGREYKSAIASIICNIETDRFVHPRAVFTFIPFICFSARTRLFSTVIFRVD